MQFSFKWINLWQMLSSSSSFLVVMNVCWVVSKSFYCMHINLAIVATLFLVNASSLCGSVVYTWLLFVVPLVTLIHIKWTVSKVTWSAFGFSVSCLLCGIYYASYDIILWTHFGFLGNHRFLHEDTFLPW